jgi:hypothetical protein
MVSLAEIHKYTKYSLLEFTGSTSNPQSPATTSESWRLVCCARQIVEPVFLTKQLIVKDMYRSFPGNLPRVHRRRKTMAGFSKTLPLPTLHICLCRLCSMSSRTELSAVVFGQYVPLISILEVFSSGVV